MAKRRYRTCVVTIDGEFYSARFLGKGQFSRVYQVGDRAVYYTKGDCTKEVLAIYQYDRIPHIPEIIRHHNIEIRRGEYWYVFSSPIYRNVKRTDTSAYKMMRRLMHWHTVYWRTINNTRYDADVMQGFVNFAYRETDLPRSVVNALQALVDVARNCGQNIGFDIIKQNFGVNDYGTLIFRDLIYVVDT